MQDHGGQLHPVQYYSAKLDINASGFGPCLWAVQATYLAFTACAPLVLTQNLTVRCPHATLSLLSSACVITVTTQTWSNCLDALTAPTITLERDKITNPSSLMMSDTQNEGASSDHNCVMLSYSLLLSVSEIPLENPDLILFTDGSAQVLDGCRSAVWVVCLSHAVIAEGHLPDHLSAHVALTNACILATSCSATIYTDSRFAFCVVHDFDIIWQ